MVDYVEYTQFPIAMNVRKKKKKKRKVLWRIMFLIFIAQIIGQESILWKYNEYFNHALF